MINSICTSPHGSESLREIFTEADNVQPGLGEIVKGIWEKDISDWKQLIESQENNGKYYQEYIHVYSACQVMVTVT